jgi:hypothetical protein
LTKLVAQKKKVGHFGVDACFVACARGYSQSWMVQTADDETVAANRIVLCESDVTQAGTLPQDKKKGFNTCS